MAATYTATGTISNLTRVELEQLRKADFFSNSKALTIGDSGLLPEGVVGRGDVNAEPYFTGPNLKLDDVYSANLPQQPGPGLTTLSSVGGILSETVRWYGPTYVFDSQVGFAFNGTTWQDNTPALNFTLFVNVGDILLIKPPNPGIGDQNANTVGTITARTANTLTVSNINNPSLPGVILDNGGSNLYSYLIVRPRAVQLFAVPGSGPVGREATFLMVDPSSTLHSNLAPSINQINADRITGIVPPVYALDTTVDRSDSVFDSPAPRASLDLLGYRIILYTDNGTGLAPDLTNPIAALNPVIDSTIPAADQRMTFDFKAGIVRFSCAPRLGDDIKVAGGVNPTSGRLSLYATFWAVDTSLTKGSARSVHAVRSTDEQSFIPGNIVFDSIQQVWKIGATNTQNELYIDARGVAEVPGTVTQFGTLDTANSPIDSRRYFGYRRTISNAEPQIGFGWRLREFSPALVSDPDVNLETRIQDKMAWSVGDGSAPSQNAGADFNPEGVFGPFGYRWFTTFSTFDLAAKKAAENGYGVLNVRRGTYLFPGGVTVPPGVEIRGEGSSTVFKPIGVLGHPTSVFRFGPNRPNGVYDFSTSITSFVPATFTWAGTLEGFDIVWNPSRRVWGIVQADPVTNEVWFNEVNTSGLALYPGNGIAIKVNANNLFTNNSPNSQHHAGSHYPRIAHHWLTDEYSVVWVEEYNPGGGIGPQVAYQGLKHNPLTAAGEYILKFTPTPFYFSAQNYLDHPSIAVDNHNFAATYLAAVSFWTYDDPVALATTEVFGIVITNTTGVTVNGFSDVLTAKSIGSSTDVDGDDNGNFLYAYSVRTHPVYYQTTGNTTAGSPFVADGSPPAGDFNVAGVTNNTRYCQLWKAANLDSGRSGLCGLVGPGAFTVRFDDYDPLKFRSTDLSAPYALIPASEVRCRPFFVAGSFGAVARVAGGTSLSQTSYQLTEREPDFVRVKHGNGQYIVVYQSFNSNSYLSQDQIQDFGRTTKFGRSATAQRQHISTCYAIVNHTGAITGPSVKPVEFNGAIDYLVVENAIAITRRSLGGRSLRVPNPNTVSVGIGPLTNAWNYSGFNNETNYEMEVSARNYCLPWSATVTPSMIPDVTWCGSDWIIVSPSVVRISSDTGTWTGAAFEDPSFLFGDDAAPFFSYMKRTVVPGTDQIYFPATAELITISAVLSEHSVLLTAPPTFGPGTHQISWVLVKGTFGGQPLGVPTGIKNPGYRVNGNGEVVVGGEFFTFAEPAADDDLTTPRNVELLDRQLWGDSTFTGDLGTGTFGTQLGRYGSSFISWNEIPTSRIPADITFKSIAVGAPKSVSWEFPQEQPMVAIAWGENFFGHMDRLLFTGDNRTNFFRQSFGPWNAGLKDLSIEAGTSVGFSGAVGLQVLSKEHVFTRHGYGTFGNPYFATDGYRNTFAHIGMSFLQASFPFGNVAPIGDLDLETAYQVSCNTVRTDALGRDPILHRGPPLEIQESPRELSDGLVTGAVDIQQYGTTRVHGGAPKVIWTGKRFVAFYTTFERAPLPLGIPFSQSISPSKTGPDLLLWPKVNSIINMVDFPGDENLDVMNDVLIGNAEQLFASFTVLDSFSVSKVVANAIFSNGAFHDWEVRDVAVIDVAYSGKVFCVVWSAGYNISGAPGSTWTGGSIVGYSLFPDLEGTSNGLFASQLPTSVQSFVLENDAFNGVEQFFTEKARFLNPKVVWDGKKFFIAYQHLADALGANDDGKFIRYIAVDEQGPGAKQHIKAMSANTVAVDTFSTNGVVQSGGIRRLGTPAFIAAIGQPIAFGPVEMFTRAGVFGIPYSNCNPIPGDIIQITGITQASAGGGGGEAVTRFNGFYPVQGVHEITGATIIDIGVNFQEFGTFPAETWFVHGVLHAGNLGVNTGEAPDGSFATAMNTRSVFALSEVTTTQPITLAAYVTRIYGMVYNERRGEYAILANCGWVLGSVGSRLRMFIIKKSTMAITKEADVTNPNLSYLPASLGWNGSQYLVVYGTAFGATTQNLNYVLVSQDLVVEQTGTIGTYHDAIWTSSSVGNKQMPGSGYDFVDPTLTVRPTLDSCHIEWNGRLGRWVVSASYVSGGSDVEPDTSHYNEKKLAIEDANNITSWIGATVTLTGATLKNQPGQRIIISRKETLLTTATASLYGGAGSATTLNGTITATATSLVVTAATFFPQAASVFLPFYIVVSGGLGSSEIMQVTNVVGTTFTVVRGFGGTSAVPHLNLAGVVWIPDDVSIVDGTLSFPLATIAAGDQVIINSPTIQQKPRRIANVRANQLFTEGSLKEPGSIGYPSTANAYTVARRGRAFIGVIELTATLTGTTVTSVTPTNFVTLGVRPGMELIILDPGNSVTGTQRTQINAITTNVNPNDTLTFYPPLSPVPASVAFWVRKQANIFANILSRSGTTLSLDVLDTDRLDPTFFSNAPAGPYNAVDKIFYIPREDTFVFTLGYTAPGVLVENADGVYLENVDIGGFQDIAERQYFTAKPLTRMGGPAYGAVGENMTRPATDHTFLTPEGKLDTIRLTNVRSKARVQYGDRGTFRSKP